MKEILLSVILALSSFCGFSQKYYTRTGQIQFNAGAGIEDITGINKTVASAFDSKSGKIQFSVLIKGFEFKSQLMEDHFNENYMESEKFPRSSFSGEIKNIGEIDFTKNGSYTITISGLLEIHGIKNQTETKGIFLIKDGIIKASADFKISLSDYDISIPTVVGDKLSKNSKINVNCNYSLMQ